MSYSYQNPHNYQHNQHNQPHNKGYYPNSNVDIYGKPMMNSIQLSQEKAMLLKEVEQNFNVKALTNQMINNVKGDLVRVTLQISKDLSLPIEIACDDMFPFTCPRITVQRQIKHEKVNPKTLEFEFYKDYPWNYQQNKAGCNLMNLITYIQSVFSVNVPKKDLLYDQVQKLEQSAINDLKILEQMNCYSLFPKQGQEELRTKMNYSAERLSTFIIQNDNYKRAVESLIQFIEFNQKLGGQLNEKKGSLDKKRVELEQIATEFDLRKDILVGKYNQNNLIKERFNKTKILGVLEQEIGKLDDEGSENIEFNFKKSSAQNQFDTKLSEYFENRKKYHRLTIKKEKLEHII